ncbi:argininosuccinate lyase [Pseudalkalibacillus decolorationis]|uniref:argininosuccinate lyase n=1 Tax=Pseudalkalibacillus decolorationis TaxID=163879 RepID=UPI0021489FCB|nr:argininosuccinate lyase [Pseudalkalibacillus decolorationis]
MKTFKEAYEENDGTCFPGKTFTNDLLMPLFQDQRENLFEAMMMVHNAHTIMLEEQQLISKEEAKTILDGIAQISKMERTTLNYSTQYEDLFFLVESKIGQVIGDELAGKMHIAKSRNDMGETMYRIVIRDYLRGVMDEVKQLGKALINQAEDHIETIMPAHTHTQPAQPTTFGHYLVAISDNLYRDYSRLNRAYNTVNQSPMGAVAITTTGFNINRERVAELLQFDGIVENSYDAIGTGDYLIEASQAIISLMTNMGRWIQELLRLASKEVGLLKVSDAYVQISSIMPQKRNPVSVEHCRALASSAVGEGLTVIQMIHNTPYGDIVDTEDDLQPHLYNGFKKSLRVLRLMRAVVTTMSFNADRAYQQARENMITITELADVLARNYQISFRKAHHSASNIAKNADQLNKELYELTLETVNEWLPDVRITEEDWNAIICPRNFIEMRKVTGGTCPTVVKEMINRRKSQW